DAFIGLDVDEALGIEVLRVDDRGVDVGEHLELARAAHVVAVARGAVAHDALGAGAALVDELDLAGLEGLDHVLLRDHAADPAVGLDAHAAPGNDAPADARSGAAIVGNGRRRGIPAAAWQRGDFVRSAGSE